MRPEAADLIAKRARELLGDRFSDEVASIVERARRYAIGEGDDDDGAWIAYELGRLMVSVAWDDPNLGAGASRLILSLVNCRAPGASKDEQRRSMPSSWDWLSQGGLDIDDPED